MGIRKKSLIYNNHVLAREIDIEFNPLQLLIENVARSINHLSIDPYTRPDFEDYENPQKGITTDVLEAEKVKLDNETAMDDYS